MREKYLAFILIMILIAVLMYNLMANSLNGNLKKIQDYDNKIKVAQEKLNSARLMDEQLEQFSEIIDNSLSRSGGFTFEEINLFKKRIGELAHERRITINKLSDANKFSLPGLLETTYNVELEATFVQMGQFLSDLEALDNIIKIHAIDITPAHAQESGVKTADTSISRYRIVIELSIFKVKKEV
ncbi:MAG: type 4a pilus biogenesis protein PilO [Candidatus Cloacimonetes bacterium]|nr:type 4a pilus biogenesis protein PilO [Candidatus Cloacimonadota bacterium]NLO11571.1 type 4a pilus biogenesis protein PilO [Candidatus Cloacimonadota bacterium]